MNASIILLKLLYYWISIENSVQRNAVQENQWFSASESFLVDCVTKHKTVTIISSVHRIQEVRGGVVSSMLWILFFSQCPLFLSSFFIHSMLANISRSLLPLIDTNQPVRLAYSGKRKPHFLPSRSPALVCIIIIIESTGGKNSSVFNKITE